MFIKACPNKIQHLHSDTAVKMNSTRIMSNQLNDPIKDGMIGITQNFPNTNSISSDSWTFLSQPLSVVVRKTARSPIYVAVNLLAVK